MTTANEKPRPRIGTGERGGNYQAAKPDGGNTATGGRGKSSQDPITRAVNFRSTHGNGEHFRRFDPATLDTLRRGLPDFMRALGVELRRNGARFIGRCPVHQDAHPSFALYGEGHAKAGCFPCGFTGDAFAVSQWLGRASTFPEAVADVARALGVAMPDHGATTGRTGAGIAHRRNEPPRIAPRPPAPIVIPSLPAGFEDACRVARWNLWRECREQSETARLVAAELGTDLDTLHSLTFTTDAVGIEWPNDKRRDVRPLILYLYEHGAKLRRWRDEVNGSRPRFEWLHGKPALPWRWHFAARREVGAVIVTEGETDAIAAIGAGLECLHPPHGQTACAVVACPGTSFPEAWGRLFARKRVTLMFDGDKAGREAAQRAGNIITPHALSVRVAKWENITKEEITT